MPPASWPSAVSFSDWWSWLSSSRWAVMSRTIAIRPSRLPPRPRSAESVTASAAGRGCAPRGAVSNWCRDWPSVSQALAPAYSAAGRKSITGRPSASSFARPKMRSAAGFQPSTRSAAVTEMIASPAEAMRCSSERFVSAISP
ncbi:MAG: hypothetical protein A3D33_06165 [Candidatus Rokubacteria bacterium RIFCSPHIGHO2_02_FULL_73_26]|nr:MAG: hypothetical protein A3D33_06165 [Candidatus Rokubacteria bacterium RIFCSPHIGHO2_02_FULL_73_26]